MNRSIKIKLTLSRREKPAIMSTNEQQNMAVVGIKLEAVLLLQNKKRPLRCPMGYPVQWGYPHANPYIVSYRKKCKKKTTFELFGWTGWAMVLGKLPMPGASYYFDKSRASAYALVIGAGGIL